MRNPTTNKNKAEHQVREQVQELKIKEMSTEQSKTGQGQGVASRKDDTKPHMPCINKTSAT